MSKKFFSFERSRFSFWCVAAVFGGFFVAGNVFASVSITPATLVGGSAISVSVDTTGTGGSGVYTPIVGPTITEGATGDIGVGNIVLNAPMLPTAYVDGFQFDTSSTVTVLVTKISGTGPDADNINGLASGSVISIPQANITVGDITVPITQTTTGGNINSITFQGIKMRPAKGLASAGVTLPLSVKFTLKGSTTSVVKGMTYGALAGTSLGTAVETVGALSYSVSTLTASPASVTADGTPTTITATITDKFGNPIPNTTVNLLSNGTIFKTDTTNSLGKVVGTLSSTKTSSSTITASVGGQNLNSSPTITFITGPSANATIVSKNTSNIEKTSFSVTENAKIIVTLLPTDKNGNSGAATTGVPVSLVSSLGYVSGTLCSATDAYSQATCYITSTGVGTANLSIAGITLTGNTSINFNPGNTVKLVVNASPSSLGFTSSSTITVSGQDIYGNATTTDSSTNVVLSADNAGTLANSVLAFSNGSANTTLSKNTWGTVHVTASSGTLTPVSTTVTFNKTDTTSPVISSHADITVEATSLDGAVATYNLPTATDNTDGSVNVSCKPASGINFPIGSTPINCSAKDSQDNSATSTFNIIIQDTTSPTTSISGAPEDWVTTDQTAGVTCSDTASGCSSTSYKIKTYSANPVTCSQNYDDYSLEALQTISSHLWVCSAVKDASGNVGFSLPTEFKVSELPPSGYSVSIDQPYANSINKNNLSFTFSGAEVGDNYSYSINDGTLVVGTNKITSAIQQITGVDASSFNDGTLTLSVVLTNQAGLVGDPVTAIVSKETTAPEIANHDDISGVTATSVQGATVNYDLPIAVDSVDGTTAVACLPISGSYFGFGKNTVTCTSQDKAGNTGTLTFAINVASTTPPTVTAPENITLTTTGTKTNVASLGSPTVSDIADPNPKITNDAPKDNMFPLGDTTVKWTATDSFGNTATAVQTITINPGPITQIILTPSTNGTTAKANQITITGEDQYQNVVINDSSTKVDLSADGNGMLDNSTVTLAKGVAKVNLSDATVETVLVKASSSNIPSAYVSVEFASSDKTAPYVTDITPGNGLDTVQLTDAISITFSEPLDWSTVTSDNIQLRRADDDSPVPAVISAVEGNRQILIKPTSALDFETQYYFAVSANVKDLAGNALNPVLDSSTEGSYSFTTVADTTTLAVTEIDLTKSSATADDSFDHGWQWVFHVTVPTDQTQLAMNFADWAGTDNASTISADNNVQIYSAQSATSKTKDKAVLISSTATLKSIGVGIQKGLANAIDLSDDLDSATPGRQVLITVDAKVPTDAVPGTYFTSYNIQSASPPSSGCVGLEACKLP